MFRIDRKENLLLTILVGEMSTGSPLPAELMHSQVSARRQALQPAEKVPVCLPHAASSCMCDPSDPCVRQTLLVSLLFFHFICTIFGVLHSKE